MEGLTLNGQLIDNNKGSQLSVKMVGGEGKTCRFYKKIISSKSKMKNRKCGECDIVFKDAFERLSLTKNEFIDKVTVEQKERWNVPRRTRSSTIQNKKVIQQ